MNEHGEILNTPAGGAISCDDLKLEGIEVTGITRLQSQNAKPDEFEKPRPLRVLLRTEDMQIQILQNAKHLATSETNSNVHLKRDMTFWREKVALYFNADSLLNKRNELKLLIDDQKTAVICVLDVLPKNCKTKTQMAENCIEGYECFENLSSAKRGVCIYTHVSLNATENRDMTKVDE